MQQNKLPEENRKKPTHKWIRQCVAGLLAGVMALGTTFSLAPDAFAQEPEQEESSAYTCGLEEHTHTEECYEKVTTIQKQVLSCTLASQPDPAADGASVTILHKHDANCYGFDNALLCTLTEREAHTHEDSCYTSPTLHTHSTECYETVVEPVCGKEESEGHTHSEECSGKTLTCQIHVCTEKCEETCPQKTEEHTHGDTCYQENTCELEESEGHTHTDACYWQLTCTLTEEQAEGERQLTCGKEEWIPHTHTEECQGEAACNKPEVLEHVHTEACFTTAEEAAADQEELTCGKDENEEHQHTSLCYGTWELKCELEEHSHEDCEEVADAFENSVAEELFPENLNALSRSGYFEYWAQYGANAAAAEKATAGTYGASARRFALRTTSNTASATQIIQKGGESTPQGENKNDNVKISKTITGTELENIFDITLTVETQENMERFVKKPDIDVVLVIDASASMTGTMPFSTGSTSKYSAATQAAGEFVAKFAEIASETSKIGCVAFNTSAQTIMGMQPLANKQAVANYNQTMGHSVESYVKSGQTGTTTNANGYTNIQAGLIAAYNLLSSSTAPNRFVVFLSDGLPTTYSQGAGITGYNPACGSGEVGTDGVFYDKIYNDYCDYGTTYSDKGAQKAEQAAAALTNAGVKIYPVGVGIESFSARDYTQRKNDTNTAHTDDDYPYYKTFDAVGYIKNQLQRAKLGFAHTVDNNVTSSNELRVVGYSGGFSGWLKSAIGNTGWFNNCTDLAALSGQFEQILNLIVESSKGDSANAWQATDTIPSDLEFIDFIPSGKSNEISCANGNIHWDLRKSQYEKDVKTEGTSTKTTYSYSVTYRVRLKNEVNGFVENKSINTNTNATLTYNTATKDGTNISYSGEKTLAFQIPSVKGYLADLSFTKKNQDGKPLSGAVFTLSHSATCNVCRGDNTTSVSITAQTATSDTNGNVSFTNIPSGHIYTLKETTVPNGYTGDPTEYTVTVAYDNVTIQNVTDLDNFTVTNTELTAKTKITGEKTLVNHNQGKHEYTFKLEEVDEQGNPVTNGTIATTTVTFDSKTENTLSFDFGDMTFKGSDLGTASSKTYYYKISENATTSDSLKADDNYYIVEVDVALDENKTELTATQTISKYNNVHENMGPVDKITFTNTLLGELRITKNVELQGTNLIPDHEFKISVRKGSQPLNPGTLYKVGNNLKYVEAGGVIHLTDDETAVFEELPVGEAYTVEEIADSAYGFTVSYNPASVTITEKTDDSPYVSIVVTNTEQTATLTLEGTKIIANPDGAEHEYTFQLQQVDASGTLIGDPVTQTVKTDQSGKFQFPITYTGTMLMGEQSKEFYYQITETTSSDLTVQTDPAVYHMTVKLESVNDQLTATPSYKKVVNSVVTPETAVTFTNTLLGSLTLNKQIIGEYPKGETFTFTISGLPNGSYTTALNGVATQVTVQNNTYTVKLTHKDSLVIYGIPHGTPLTITEAKSAYTARYVVNSGWQRNGNSVTVDVSTAGTEVLFKNYSPYGLPQTGQLNWPIPVLAILGIACVGGGILLMRRKKGKHEK